MDEDCDSIIFQFFKFKWFCIVNSLLIGVTIGLGMLINYWELSDIHNEIFSYFLGGLQIIKVFLSIGFVLIIPGLMLYKIYTHSDPNRFEGLEAISIMILLGFAWQIITIGILTILQIFITEITLLIASGITNFIIALICFILYENTKKLNSNQNHPNLRQMLKYIQIRINNIDKNEILLGIYLLLCGIFVNIRFPFTYVEDVWYHMNVLNNAIQSNTINMEGYRGFFGITAIMTYLYYSVSTDIVFLSKWIYPLLMVWNGGILLKTVIRFLLNNSNWARLGVSLTIIFLIVIIMY